MTIDLYELEDANKEFNFNNIILEYAPLQLQFCGEEPIKYTGKYRLNFNHVNQYLFFRADNCSINDFSLFFNSVKINIDMNNVIIFDNHYIIPLTKSIELNDLLKYGINSSKIDRIDMRINFVPNNDLHNEEAFYIYSISLNGARSSNGIFGLRFSK